MEVKQLKETQNLHQSILAQLQENSQTDSETDIETPKINSPKKSDNDFLGLINKLKIQKFYINIKIIIHEFVLETVALFDTGADSNCILEGLIPTKYFEKTSEQLSTANGSKIGPARGARWRRGRRRSRRSTASRTRRPGRRPAAQRG